MVSLFFQYTIGLALAVFFRRSFPLSSVLRALFLVPWLLPIIVSGTTWQWMMDADSGIINRFLGVFGIDPVWWLNAEHALMSVTIANIWLGIPFNLVILYSGLQNIPADLYEAAALDGAGPWRQFWSITFPLLRPVTAITLLLGFVYTLKVVDIIWIMTMGTGSSQTLATWAYAMAFGKGASAVIKYSRGLRRGHDPPGRRPRHGLRLPRRPAPAGGDDEHACAAPGGRRPLGVFFTAIMLFPVYWMVNVSLTPRADDPRRRPVSRRT